MAIPVSLEDAARHLRLTADESVGREADLQDFVADAAGWVEKYTGHLLTERQVTETLATFDGSLTAWPIKPAVAVALAYGAPGATPTIITGAALRLSGRPARLVRPAALPHWPRLAAGETVTVTYTAGYADGDAVPRNFRRAMLVLIGAYDADREGGEILAAAEESARGLCRDFRLRRL